MKNIFENREFLRTEKGFIDKKTILKYVSEEDIFELVFGFKPKEYDYVASPFRYDRRPGCYFEFSLSGKLTFVDFGSQIRRYDKQMIRIDCFDAVQIYFNLPNLYQTMRFIRAKLIEGKELEERIVKPLIVVQKPEVEILFESKNFEIADRDFWKSKYEIEKIQLIEDQVYSVYRYSVKNSKYGNYTIHPKSLTYCFNEFKNGNKKIYRPLETGKRRFVTTCTKNDIGGLHRLPKNGKKLIITKSYKDWRVLINQGLHAIWFQNEGMFPDLEYLLPICNRFEQVIIFFDNDETGIKQSLKLQNIINSFLPGFASITHLPLSLFEKGITDPSDLIYNQGRSRLLDFLSYKKLLNAS